jgi:hypothetical protein
MIGRVVARLVTLKSSIRLTFPKVELVGFVQFENVNILLAHLGIAHFHDDVLVLEL